MKVLPDGSAPCLLLLGANSLFVSSFFFFLGGGVFFPRERNENSRWDIIRASNHLGRLSGAGHRSIISRRHQRASMKRPLRVPWPRP